MSTGEEKSPRDRFRDSAKSDLDEPESALWTGKYSAKTMIGSWIGAGLATLILPIALGVSPVSQYGIAWTILIIMLLLTWAWLGGIAFYRKLSDQYEVTTQRLKHREGILFRKNNRIEMIDIDDVMYKQGPIQALLGIGSITIQSSDTSHPELVMEGIADVKRVTDMIDDARRAERRKRGLHIESV